MRNNFHDTADILVFFSDFCVVRRLKLGILRPSFFDQKSLLTICRTLQERRARASLQESPPLQHSRFFIVSRRLSVSEIWISVLII